MRTERRMPARAARRYLLALLAGLALLVAACTGTSEEQSSTLLIVGTVEGGTNQLALVEDRQDGTAVGERMPAGRSLSSYFSPPTTTV